MASVESRNLHGSGFHFDLYVNGSTENGDRSRLTNRGEKTERLKHQHMPNDAINDLLHNF